MFLRLLSVRYFSTRVMIEKPKLALGTLSPCSLASSEYFALTKEAKEDVSENDFLLFNNFLDGKQQELLWTISNQKLKRLKYQSEHFDSVIKRYRESIVSFWPEEVSEIFEKVYSIFRPLSLKFQPVHILDLEEQGSIGPHIDNVQYSGGIVAGISLNSSSIMRLRKKDTNSIMEVLLQPGSFYIQMNQCRYEYTHEILGPHQQPSLLQNVNITRKRRISLIFRDDKS